MRSTGICRELIHGHPKKASPGPSGSMNPWVYQMGSFPKLGISVRGSQVPIIELLLFWGLYGVLPFLETTESAKWSEGELPNKQASVRDSSGTSCDYEGL